MKESPIFSRTYDMLLWLIPQTLKFPRAHRFGLGERVTHLALDFQETRLAQLRQSLRLCKDLRLLSLGQYEHIAAQLVEIGRLLGGWKKSISMGQADSGAGGARRLVEQ
jgi:hypothetical protein